MPIQSKSIIQLSAALLLIVIAIVVGSAGYVFITNPEFNHIIKNTNKALEARHNAALEQELKQWHWNYNNQINTADEQYPMVVLRTGYKVLKIQNGRAFIGWSYELINTSPSTSYVATVNFNLTDADGFKLNGSTQSSYTSIAHHGFDSIKDIIEIDESDIPRLKGSTWTLSLSPNWSDNEGLTKRKRYERLADLVRNDRAPPWVYARFTGDPSKKGYFDVGEKWIPVIKALNP